MFNLRGREAGAEGSGDFSDVEEEEVREEEDEEEEGEVEEEEATTEEATSSSSVVSSTSSSLASLPPLSPQVRFAYAGLDTLTPMGTEWAEQEEHHAGVRFEAKAKSDGRRVELEVVVDRGLLVVRPAAKKVDPSKAAKKKHEDELKQQKLAEKEIKKQKNKKNKKKKKRVDRMQEKLVMEGMEDELTNNSNDDELHRKEEKKRQKKESAAARRVMVLDLHDLEVIERTPDQPAVRLVWRYGSESQMKLVDSKKSKKAKVDPSLLHSMSIRQESKSFDGSPPEKSVSDDGLQERREESLPSNLLLKSASQASQALGNSLHDLGVADQKRDKPKRKGSYRLISSLHKASHSSQAVRKIMKGADLGAFPVGDIVSEKLDRLVQRAEKNDNKRRMQERYKFVTPEIRQRFYEALHAARRTACDDSDQHSVTLFIGTWNMGNAVPPAVLDDWIPKNQYDMYFIATQESTYDLEGEDEGDEKKMSGEHLTALLEEHMASDYKLVAKRSLWAIRGFLFARSSLASKITNLDISSVATGVGEVLGNKGAVGISFNFDETSICLISSHFAAHEKNVDDRNQNYSDIASSLDLHRYHGCELVNSHDHFFWCGDLNYRIQMERSQVIKAIEEEDWPTLLAHDQLIREMDKGNCFPGFHEGAIAFRPTYRYTRGVREYNEEKERVPSWCDRILWRSVASSEVKQLEYTACDGLMTSDHSPVRAVFIVPTIPPGCRATTSSTPCTISITQLKGVGLPSMNGDGSSDPYIKFLAPDLLNEPPKTVCLRKTLDPVWPRDGIPTLFPFTWDRDQLINEKLFLIVKDWNKRLKNRNIGQAVLPLVDACGPSPVAFSVPIYRNGFPSGTITGFVHVTWVNDEPEVAETVRRIEEMSDDDAWALLKGLLSPEATPDPRLPLLALLRGDAASFHFPIRSRMGSPTDD